MLMSMAYLDQILPVSSTVEAVQVIRRVSSGPGLPKILPTDVASPCVHCLKLVAAFLYRMRISRVRACTCIHYVYPRTYACVMLPTVARETARRRAYTYAHCAEG